MDLDAYLYRQFEDGTRQMVGSSAGATADEAAIAENLEPGLYVLRVVNWLSPDFLYTGNFAVYGPGPVIHRDGTKESWTLTCEQPDGTVVDTQKVTVDRGQRLAVVRPLRGQSAPAAAPRPRAAWPAAAPAAACASASGARSGSAVPARSRCR